ncbi:MAG: trypsin-like peptidase domain-containing protein [Planctomycetes bacterium]|nr:trypsin-like peptidase domain-containing protein [Planctomycetota bacterium]
MRRLSLEISLIVILFWATSLAAEDLKPETIRRGKQATALVVLGRGFGSAFCIDPSGYFITNQHVIAKIGKNDKVRLVLNTAEANEKTFEAEVVRSDKTADLALLRIKDGEKHKFTALVIGGVDELIETQQLVAFGYPFGTALAVKEKKYPSISVNVGRITALRKTKGKLQQIQLDAQLNPGNSGGPVLNTAGKVVGIVRSGVLRTGVNFAIPVTHLDGFLAKPELTVASPTVPFKDRHEPLELTIRVARFSKAGPKLDVEVVVGNSQAVAPFVAARTEDAETYRVRIVPVPRRENAVLVPIAITFSAGSVRCKTPDGDVLLDGKKYRLSNISRIERSEKDNEKGHLIVLKNGKQLTGKKLSVGKLQADFGGYVLPLDADRASTIVVYSVEPESDTITFRVVARQDGKLVATASGVISLERPAAEVASAGPRPGAHTCTGHLPIGIRATASSTPTTPTTRASRERAHSCRHRPTSSASASRYSADACCAPRRSTCCERRSSSSPANRRGTASAGLSGPPPSVRRRRRRYSGTVEARLVASPRS